MIEFIEPKICPSKSHSKFSNQIQIETAVKIKKKLSKLNQKRRTIEFEIKTYHITQPQN